MPRVDRQQPLPSAGSRPEGAPARGLLTVCGLQDARDDPRQARSAEHGSGAQARLGRGEARRAAHPVPPMPQVPVRGSGDYERFSDALTHQDHGLYFSNVEKLEERILGS